MMDVQPSFAIASWVVLVIVLLAGLCLAGVLLALAVAASRKRGAVERGAVAGSLILLGVVVVGLSLLFPLLAQHREVERRVASQNRLRALGQAMHSETVEKVESGSMPGPLGSIPIEVPQKGVSSEPLPAWITNDAQREDDRALVVVSGQQFADPDRAERDALSRATAMLTHDFMNSRRPWGTFVLNPEQVRQMAVRRSHTQTIERTAGENAFTVYRTYLQVEQSDATRHAVEAIWKEQTATWRSVAVGGLIVLLTAIAGVVAGYFRLDDRSGGRYRWRLRFAAVAALLLIGGTVLAGTRLAAHTLRHRPVDTAPHAEPVEAPLPMAHRLPSYELPPPPPIAPPEQVVFEAFSIDCPNGHE